MVVMRDGSELLERLMKVFLTLLLKMQLLGWQLLLVLRLVILLRVKRVSWFQVWCVSISLSSSLSPVPDSYTSLICHQSPLPICLAPLEDPISLATASSLTTSGDHTETQSSQDYG
jgi:hypothetical protein